MAGGTSLIDARPGWPSGRLLYVEDVLTQCLLVSHWTRGQVPRRERMNRKPRSQLPVSEFIHGWIPYALLAGPSEFQDLQEYLLEVDAFLRKEAKSFGDKVSAEVARSGLKGDDAEDYYSAHEGEFTKWHDGFPATVRSSVLVAACSRFEGSLVQCCKDFGESSDISTATTWAQTIGKGVHKAERFLRQNYDIHLADHHAWSRIGDYYKLRDCFVHANGDPSYMSAEHQAKLYHAISRLAPHGASLGRAGALAVSIDLLRKVTTDMAAFWEEFRDACTDNAIIGPSYWK